MLFVKIQNVRKCMVWTKQD